MMFSLEAKAIIFRIPHFILTFVYGNSTLLIFHKQYLKK
jgi:hypothetical protein